ncbi:MAG: hypothetical protein NZM38_03570 [Cytophagales bacterium]|nr:hypothetical protein [Cytophagales bacterium]MDW8383831.1 hypothetical protein [Flammeovirgaceae bacterium]
MKKLLIFLVLFILVATLATILLKPQHHKTARTSTIQSVITRTEKNYGEEIEKYCQKFNLPAEYFKALVILECSGAKPAPSRFEPKVFEKLKRVKYEKDDKFDVITPSDLEKYSDRELIDLATSWGPLQIMGYHSIPLNIHIKELKGEKSLYYSILWANQNYGYLLRKKDFKNAFHFHNTGRMHPNGLPQTYHRNYVSLGIEYTKKFQKTKKK